MMIKINKILKSSFDFPGVFLMYDKNPSHTSVPPFKACLDKRKKLARKRQRRAPLPLIS
jgi:hypothetical protein